MAPEKGRERLPLTRSRTAEQFLIFRLMGHAHATSIVSPAALFLKLHSPEGGRKFRPEQKNEVELSATPE
jgi:hypothetical protein